MYEIRIVDSLAQLDGLAGSWSELLAHSENPTVFNTCAWARCWQQVYWQPDYILHIILVYEGAELVALLPLYIQSHTRTCWFLGSGEPEDEEVASEYLDFIVRDSHGQHPELAALVAAQLDTLAQYRLILVNCREGSYAARLLHGRNRVLFTSTGAVYQLQIKDSLADTATAFSRRLFKNARQCIHRFEAAPDVEYVGFHSNTFDVDWQALQTLHQKDWVARGKSGAFHKERFSRFHALMHTQHPEIRQVFAAIMINGEPLAIHHFYVFGKNYYFYLAGTEKTRESRLSPGLLLHALAMQELSGQGITYDFLKGAAHNSYKSRFCAPGELFYDITIFENSLRGHGRHWLVRLKRFIHSLRKPAAPAEGLTNEDG